MTQKQYTDNELLELLQQANSEVEGSITQAEISTMGDYPSFGVYFKRFGSWNQAKEQAGLPTNTHNQQKIKDEEIVERLNNGQTLTEIAEETGYSTINTISESIAKRRNINIRNKMSVANPYGGRIVSITTSLLKDMGINPDPDNNIYYELQPHPEKEQITIHIHQSKAELIEEGDQQ